MTGMFCGCSGLTSLDLSNFNTANVTSMGLMFDGCSGLTSLDLSNFNTANVKDMSNMFYGCSKLQTIYVGSEWSTENVQYGHNMFKDCWNLVGGAGTKYDDSHTYSTYARIDGGESSPGYFTDAGKSLQLIVSNPEGEDITKYVTITWYTSDGKELGTGSKLNGVEEGSEIAYSVGLDEKLGRKYREVKMQKITIESDTITYQLNEIGQTTIRGHVTHFGEGVPKADVSIIQWANGRYGMEPITIQTDGNGMFATEVLNDSTEVTISCHGYLNKTMTLKKIGEGLNLGDIELEQVKGKIALISLTYQAAVREGTTPETQDWYDDMRNLEYAVHNSTKNKDVDFAMQQGDIVMPTGVEAGDRIVITTKSLNKRFADTSVEAVMADNDTIRVGLKLVQYGGVEVNYVPISDSHIQVLIFNGEGVLVSHSGFYSQKITFNALEADNYSLVLLNSRLGAISAFADLERMGLKEGQDYIKREVSVNDGIIASVDVNEELADMASQYDVVMSNSSFLSEKQEVIEGNYLTLSAIVNINPMFSESIKNAQLEIVVPEGCEFFSGSLVIGNKLTPYAYDNNRISIALQPENIGKRIRFCVTPNKAGDYTCTALFSSSCNNGIPVSIGCASFSAETGNIAVREKTSLKSVNVTGMVPAHADVDIYDNDHLISSVKAKGDGSINTLCELYKPYNLSTHKIYAKYKTSSGEQRTTATHECFYEKASGTAKSVTMSYYNGWYRKNFDVVFDFEKGTISDRAYQFYTATDFTFVADLENNDTISVDAVTFYVHTTDKTVRVLPGFFNTSLGRWVAVSKFDSNNLPVNLSVDVTLSGDDYSPLADTQQATDLLEGISEYVTTAQTENKDLDDREEEIAKELENENDNIDIDGIKKKISEYDGFDFSSDDIDNISPEDFESRLAAMIANTESLAKDIDEFSNDSIEEFRKYYEKEEISDDGSVWIRKTSDCAGISEENLINAGYKKIPSTTGVLLSYVSEDLCDYVDFANNIRFTYTLKSAATRSRAPEWMSNGEALLNAVRNAYQNALTDRDNLNRILNMANAQRAQHLERIAFEERECRSLLNMVETDLRREFTFTQFRNRSTILRELNHIEKRRARLMRIPRRLSMISSTLSTLNEIVDIYQRIVVNFGRINNFRVGDCVQKNNPQARQILENKHNTVSREFWEYARWRACMYVTQRISNAWFGRIPVADIILGILQDAAVSIRDNQFDRFVVTEIDQLYKYNEDAERSCIRKEKTDNEEPQEDEPKEDKKTPKPQQERTIPKDQAPEPPIQKSITPIHDPSGYVYEAVTSNRLKDVTTTVYYLEGEEPKMWDAEDFSQVNPIVTDETGLYRWDVPQGMWKVRYEKNGYETKQTDWLPVPPPQMEINIPMEQAISPVVESAKGVESGISLSFSKYLKPESIKSSSMTAVKESQNVKGDVEMLNLEEDPYTGNSYASKVKFVPTTPFTVGDVVYLTVKKAVESYCGATLTADTTIRVVIEKEIEKIAVDSLVNVNYRGEQVIDISVLPADAVKGMTLKASSVSPMIATMDKEVLTLDDEGHAKVTVSGKLPGTTALKWQLDGTDMEATTIIDVITGANIVKMPKASILSGKQVEEGTLLFLTCETEGATIYYTLDGSCPCDVATRKTYTEPIILPNGEVTVKVIAERKGMESSDIATFVYVVNGGTGIKTAVSEGNISVSYNGRMLIIQGAEGGLCYVYDYQGREIISRSNLSKKESLRVPKANVYFVSVKTRTSETIVKKIVIK